MVGTRHSLPSALAAADEPAEDAEPPAGVSKKAQAALKKLQIDGKGAMLGEKPRHDQLETYHFRGAVYAVSTGTKKEWLEAEPERYRRRRGGKKESVEVKAEDSGYGRSSEDVASRTVTPVGSARRVRFGGGSGSAARGGGGGRKRKRKRSTSGEDEAMEEYEQGEQHRKKRPRVLGARKSAYTIPPPSQPRHAGASSPRVQATSKSQRSLPPRPVQSSTPAANHPNAPGLVASNRDAYRKSSPGQQFEKLRQTQRSLMTIAKMNTQYEKISNGLKKIHLQQRLRESRHGGGNQLSAIPDPRRPYPRPEAPPSNNNPEDDDDERAPRANPPIMASSPPTSSNNTPLPPPTLTRHSYSLTDHLTNADRAESHIFSARRAGFSISNHQASGNTGPWESTSMRKRRANREMDTVRNLWSPEAEAADEST